MADFVNGQYLDPFGNPVDLSRPILHNSDGSVSTERAMTVGADGKFYRIPTIVEGKERSQEEALKLWQEGKNPHIGVFDTAEQAEQSAKERSPFVMELLRNYLDPSQ